MEMAYYPVFLNDRTGLPVQFPCISVVELMLRPACAHPWFDLQALIHVLQLTNRVLQLSNQAERRKGRKAERRKGRMAERQKGNKLISEISEISGLISIISGTLAPS